MIKSVIILMNILALLVVRISFASPTAIEVNVKIDAPSQVKQGEEFTLSLTIYKGTIAGVGHIRQTLPTGFGNAAVVEEEDSEFKYQQEGNAVKFIWISLPADHEFTVSYKIKVSADAPTGNVHIAGKFSYVLDNQKQTFMIPDVSITVIGKTSGTTTTISTTIIQRGISDPATAEPARKDPSPKDIPLKSESTATPEIPVTSAAPKNESAPSNSNPKIIFKVQIGAFKESAPTAAANRFHRIAMQGFQTYKDERGLIIYTVGEFSEFESANNLKTKLISNGLSDAFVIAFKDGKKISASAARELINNK